MTLEYKHKRIVFDKIKIETAKGLSTVTVNGIRMKHFHNEDEAIEWAKKTYPED